MKTIKYLLFAFIAPFVLAGCSDDIKYTPGEGEDPDCYGVYFPSQDKAHYIFELESILKTFKIAGR